MTMAWFLAKSKNVIQKAIRIITNGNSTNNNCTIYSSIPLRKFGKHKTQERKQKSNKNYTSTQSRENKVGKMNLIDKLKEWWNKPSWENELCKDYNDIIVKFAQDLEEQRGSREEKLKSYESMSERELLVEIAKNTLKGVE